MRSHTIGLVLIPMRKPLSITRNSRRGPRLWVFDGGAWRKQDPMDFCPPTLRFRIEASLLSPNGVSLRGYGLPRGVSQMKG